MKGFLTFSRPLPTDTERDVSFAIKEHTWKMAAKMRKAVRMRARMYTTATHVNAILPLIRPVSYGVVRSAKEDGCCDHEKI